MHEEFVDLGGIDDEHWAYRLTNNNEKSIEITKSDLIEFINYETPRLDYLYFIKIIFRYLSLVIFR
jgi:hypothetical protein